MNIQIANPTNQIPQCESKYPYLSQSLEGSIVLFTKKDTGIVLKSLNFEFGHYGDDWNEGNFTKLPPDVKITLSND